MSEPLRVHDRLITGQKRFWRGTQRGWDPQDTVERVFPHAQRAGLTRLPVITHLDRIGIPVVLSVRPTSISISVDAGKGFTLAAAKASALMETLERSCAENARPELISGTERMLRSDWRVVDTARLPQCQGSFFNPDLPYTWSRAWDLNQNEEVLVPEDLARFARHPGFFPGYSNGLSAGNNLAEAVAYGLYEVIERDAVAQWKITAGRGPDPAVDLSGRLPPLVGSLVERLQSVEMGVMLMDCTSDLGVPTYIANLYDDAQPRIGVYRGYGTHLDPEIAMIRAITEAVQARLVFISGSRDDFLRDDHLVHRRVAEKSARYHREGQRSLISPLTHQDRTCPTFEEDIRFLMDILHEAGMEQVLVVPFTPPEQKDYTVVRVIVPGLEGYIFDNWRPGARAKAALAEV